MELDQVVAAIEGVLSVRLSEMRAEIDNLRAEVGEAVEQIRDTAQVLHDNDIAVMAKMAEVQGSVPGEVVRQAGESWARFVRNEAEQLGWKVMVPK